MNNLQVNTFWEEKTLWKVNSWYQRIIKLIISYNKGSCFEHIPSGVNIHLYGCVSLLAPECVVCVFVILNQRTSKKPNYKPDISKLGALLHKIHIKVYLHIKI